MALSNRRLELRSTVGEVEELLVQKYGPTQLLDLPVHLELAGARRPELRVMEGVGFGEGLSR